jgi:hypothetical protein
MLKPTQTCQVHNLGPPGTPTSPFRDWIQPHAWRHLSIAMDSDDGEDIDFLMQLAEMDSACAGTGGSAADAHLPALLRRSEDALLDEAYG